MALELHSSGLQKLSDPNWTGIELYNYIKNCILGRNEPFSLLRRTLKKGLLYYLGVWLIEEYFSDNQIQEELSGEYRAWYLEDYLDALDRFHCKMLNSYRLCDK